MVDVEAHRIFLIVAQMCYYMTDRGCGKITNSTSTDSEVAVCKCDDCDIKPTQQQ